jgi:hypothetical protein
LDNGNVNRKQILAIKNRQGNNLTGNFKVDCKVECTHDKRLVDRDIDQNIRTREIVNTLPSTSTYSLFSPPLSFSLLIPRFTIGSTDQHNQGVSPSLSPFLPLSLSLSISPLSLFLPYLFYLSLSCSLFSYTCTSTMVE